ncbi:MAG: ABC transporter permease [Campylobacterales bacterium]|nr:ABC transporter permease [Campylobacterales bacterium]
MIEIVFAIVIIGILAAVAIPRLAATRDDAVLVKGKSQVSAIRSGIALQRSLRLMRGEANQNPATLDGAAANTENTALFFFNDGNQSNILESPIMSRNADGGWMKPNGAGAPFVYRFRLTNAINVDFTYNPGTGSFTCPDNANCRNLTQ